VIGTFSNSGGAGRNGELNDFWKIHQDEEQKIKIENMFSQRAG
jgi:hypothetical protein